MKKTEFLEQCERFNNWLDLSLLSKNIDKRPINQNKNNDYCVWTDENIWYGMERISTNKHESFWNIICESQFEEEVYDRMFQYLLAKHYAYIIMDKEIKSKKFSNVFTYGVYALPLTKGFCQPIFVSNEKFYFQEIENDTIVNFREVSPNLIKFIKPSNTVKIKVAIGHAPIIAYFYEDKEKDIDIRYVGRKNEMKFLLEFYLKDNRIIAKEKENIRELIK